VRQETLDQTVRKITKIYSCRIVYTHEQWRVVVKKKEKKMLLSTKCEYIYIKQSVLPDKEVAFPYPVVIVNRITPSQPLKKHVYGKIKERNRSERKKKWRRARVHQKPSGKSYRPAK